MSSFQFAMFPSLGKGVALVAIVTGLLSSAPSLAQQELRFGPWIKAEDPSAAPPSVPLLSGSPPRELINGAEILMVAGAQFARENEDNRPIKVSIDRPGSQVVLILAMSQDVRWEVEYTDQTRLRTVIVVPGSRGRLYMAKPVPAYAMGLDYALDTTSPQYKRMQDDLHNKLGIDRIDAFLARRKLPNAIPIHKLDFVAPEAAYAPPKAQPAGKVVEFPLLTADYAITTWRLDGPVGKAATASSGFITSPTTAAGGGRVYTLNDGGLTSTEKGSAKTENFALPFSFPRFSHPKGVAYDSKRDVVAVVTLGGEGYLYRFSGRTGKWLDYQSMDNIDANSLFYDAKADRFVAWTDRGITFISAEGRPLNSISIRDKLPEYGRIRFGAMKLVAQGEDLAVVAFNGNDVKAIWHYDMATQSGKLTYLKDPEAGSQAGAVKTPRSGQ